MTKVERTLKSVCAKLDEYGYKYEAAGDTATFVIAPTAHVLTENCTIDIWKNQIKVNEKPVNDVYEMIDIVIEVEGNNTAAEDTQYIILKESNSPLKYGLYRTKDGMTNTSPYMWKLFGSVKKALKWANENGLNAKDGSENNE